MKLRTSLVAVLAVFSIGAVTVPIVASAEVGIYFNIPPPPPRYEAVPAPRAGYLWSGGYWNMRNNRHVWQRGHWERERSGYYRTEPAWTQRDNRWHLNRGGWNRGDRDGDGVPNSRDRAPDNPRRN